jgi:hypothetical protein
MSPKGDEDLGVLLMFRKSATTGVILNGANAKAPLHWRSEESLRHTNHAMGRGEILRTAPLTLTQNDN